MCVCVCVCARVCPGVATEAVQQCLFANARPEKGRRARRGGWVWCACAREPVCALKKERIKNMAQ